MIINRDIIYREEGFRIPSEDMKLTSKQLCDKWGCSYGTFCGRYYRGWTMEQALGLVPPPKGGLVVVSNRYHQMSDSDETLVTVKQISDTSGYPPRQVRYKLNELKMTPAEIIADGKAGIKCTKKFFFREKYRTLQEISDLTGLTVSQVHKSYIRHGQPPTV